MKEKFYRRDDGKIVLYVTNEPVQYEWKNNHSFPKEIPANIKTNNLWDAFKNMS